MASNGSSEVDPEDDNGENVLSAEKTGRAAEFPDFAIIWSFLDNFRHLLHFPDLSLDGLEDGFNSHSRENGNVETVEELFKKLLRRLGVSVNPEKWEKSLLKVAKEQNLDCAWNLEQFGYEELKVSSKLELFKVLLECQFDQNEKLKSSVNKGYEADELRMEPIGRDLDGYIYWYHEDESNGIRLYLTEEDEVNCESWRLVAGVTDELAAIVDYLESKSQMNPKETALQKREEMKKKGDIKSPGKKKGRKAKKKGDSQEDDYDDDNPCARCFSNVRPDSILLCDKCDAAYHTACLRPPLLTVPQGDWYCPFCQQLALLEILREKTSRLAARMRLRQRQAKRLGFAGIDLNNILECGSDLFICGSSHTVLPVVGKHSDDDDELGIRRSGRARKTVDYTFKEFEDDITSAVENDRKRFVGQEEVNGDDHLMYSKPAFESGRFFAASKRGTRRSRRLRDLDYESDSESRTSGYENEVNSDDDGDQQTSTSGHVHKKRQRRLIDDDDDEDGGDDGCGKNTCHPEDEPTASGREMETVNQEPKSDIGVSRVHPGRERTNDNSLSSASDAESEGSGPSLSQPQNTAQRGRNKIHPHSKIASVVPVARSQPTKYRAPPDYNQQATLAGSSNFNTHPQGFHSNQSTNSFGPTFGRVNVVNSNTVGANVGPVSTPPQASIRGPVAPIGSGFVQGESAETTFGGTCFPKTNFGGSFNPESNFGGANVPSRPYAGNDISETNFRGSSLTGVGAQSLQTVGSNSGASNVVGTNLGSSLGGGDFSRANVASYGMMKSPTQTAPGLFWGSQNKSSNSFSYPGFSGTAPVPGSSVNNPSFPTPYNQLSGYGENNHYDNVNQQFQASPTLHTNYFPPQQSGNFQGSSFLSSPPQRPPPPPYSATNSLNANFFTNNCSEAPFPSSQWPYPEGYRYYPGQSMGNAAGQNF